MKNWKVMRGNICLGHYIAEELRLVDGNLGAYNYGRCAGSIASGKNLTWESVGFNFKPQKF